MRYLRHLAGIEALPAAKDVHGGVAVLRPRVDADVRFGDGDETGHPHRMKLVETLAHNCGARLFRCPEDRAADEVEIVKQLAVAALQL